MQNNRGALFCITTYNSAQIEYCRRIVFDIRNATALKDTARMSGNKPHNEAKTNNATRVETSNLRQIP